MLINGFRSFLYGLAKGLGDVQAVDKAGKTGSVKPIVKRLERRLLGKLAGRLIGKITR